MNLPECTPTCRADAYFEPMARALIDSPSDIDLFDTIHLQLLEAELIIHDNVVLLQQQ